MATPEARAMEVAFIENSPLFMAAITGREAEVEARLSAGDDVNQECPEGSIALFCAVFAGRERIVRTLLEAGANVNHVAAGRTALMLAAKDGNTACVSMLLRYGASVSYENEGENALCLAIDGGHSDTISVLLASGSSVEHAPVLHSPPPIMRAIIYGALRPVQVLSSFLAKRNVEFVDDSHSVSGAAEQLAELLSTTDDPELQLPQRERPEIVAWLHESAQWSTPLHHLTIIDADRARALLRDGADLHACTDAPEAPTPLSLARSLRAAGNAAPGSPADLVLRAAMPWSPKNHELFPTAVRARAVDLLLIGRALAREPRFGPVFEHALIELWDDVVMPAALLKAGEK